MTRFALLSSLLKILVLALQEVSDGACFIFKLPENGFSCLSSL